MQTKLLITLLAFGQAITGLCSELFISEIVAANGKTLKDEFGETSDWIELHNVGIATEDLSGWRIRDESGEYVFPSNTYVPAGGLLVLVQDRDAFQLEFPDAGPILGNLGFGLSGAGEQIVLEDRTGLVIDEVHYGDSYPWPPEADGDGPTLELVDPSSDNADPANWRLSRARHGSPGVPGRR